MILAIDYKVCPRCGKEKTIDNFKENKSHNGRSKWCIQCKREYEKEYREKNAEKIKISRELRKDKYNNARKIAYRKYLEKSHKRLKNWYDSNPQSRLWSAAKSRAKRDNLPFNINKEDIIIPEKCPALGIKLSAGNGNSKDSSPSLDKIIASKGYVKGNIVVVSHKANTMKSNATIEELEQLVEFYKKLIEGAKQ